MSDFPMHHDTLYCASCDQEFEWMQEADGTDWIEGEELDCGDVERFQLEQECPDCAMERHPHAGIV